MCTAITLSGESHYFGRNLDLEYSYGETVTITPRQYPFKFIGGQKLEKHYAMIGIAYVVQDYPLYYDATNEKGLSIAALNFPGNAVYQKNAGYAKYIASFEVIPWLLSRCKNIDEVKKELAEFTIVDDAFSQALQPTPLHWFAADKYQAITIETTVNGLKIYDNYVGVLTNNPPFDYHLNHLSEFMNVTSQNAENHFALDLPIEAFSRGMGGKGLPGDLSSSSRFIRAAFVKWNSIFEHSYEESINQFFHILASVEQQKGCARLENGACEMTLYSSCCNTEKGIYYYRTYGNSQITAVDMRKENQDGNQLISYPIIRRQQILYQN